MEVTNTNNGLNGAKTAALASDCVMLGVGNPAYKITVLNDGHGTAGANPNPAAAGENVLLTYLADSGYRFKEWQVISGSIDIRPDNTFSMPASAVTVKAIFEDIPDYTVTVSDDGHGTGSAEPSAADAGVPITITAANGMGYRFAAWQVISGAVTLADSASATTTFVMPAGDVEVKATFTDVEPGLYTLNLQSSTGGTAFGGGEFNQSTGVNLFATPQSGYAFKEWELVSGTFDISNITKVSDNWYQFPMPASHLVLKAVFEQAAPGSYTVTIDYNGNGHSHGSTMPQQTLTGGVAGTLSPNLFMLTGHAFAGWALSPTGSVVYADGADVTFAADTTLYAVWRPLETYTVTFDANGGSGTMSNQTFTEGMADGLLNNAFTRVGHVFSGWSTTPAGSAVYTNNESVTIGADTPLYAVWYEAGSASYTVTFDANGGDVSPASVQTGEDGKLSSLPVPTRTDYVFNGWYTDAAGGDPVTIHTVFEADDTVFAHWTPVSTDSPPTVVTVSVTNIDDREATLTGEVTAQGSSAVIERGFAVNVTPNPLYNAANSFAVALGTGTGSFSGQLTELAPGSTYYIRAYAINEFGVSYGEDMDFTTLEDTTEYGVTTNDATAITADSATLNGGVLLASWEQSIISARGFVYSAEPGPDLEDANDDDAEATGGDDFSADISGLAADTTYYVRAYVSISGEYIIYGNEKTFTTLTDGGTQEPELPTVTTDAIDSSGVTQNSAGVSGSVTSDGGAQVTERGFAYGISTGPTTAGDKLQSGDGTGSFNLPEDKYLCNTLRETFDVDST